MGEMMGNIAHQWRQPLNTLGLIIQKIAFTYNKGSLTDEVMKTSLSKSINIIMQMSNTIDDFKNFFEVIFVIAFRYKS